MTQLQATENEGPTGKQLAQLMQELAGRKVGLLQQKCRLAKQEVQLGSLQLEVKQGHQDLARKRAQLADLNKMVQALGLPPVLSLDTQPALTAPEPAAPAAVVAAAAAAAPPVNAASRRQQPSMQQAGTSASARTHQPWLGLQAQVQQQQQRQAAVEQQYVVQEADDEPTTPVAATAAQNDAYPQPACTELVLVPYQHSTANHATPANDTTAPAAAAATVGHSTPAGKRRVIVTETVVTHTASSADGLDQPAAASVVQLRVVVQEVRRGASGVGQQGSKPTSVIIETKHITSTSMPHPAAYHSNHPQPPQQHMLHTTDIEHTSYDSYAHQYQYRPRDPTPAPCPDVWGTSAATTGTAAPSPPPPAAGRRAVGASPSWCDAGCRGTETASPMGWEGGMSGGSYPPCAQQQHQQQQQGCYQQYNK